MSDLSDIDPMIPMAMTAEQEIRVIALRLALGTALGPPLYDVADELGRYIATGAHPRSRRRMVP